MFFCEHGMPCSHSYAQDIALDFYDRMIPICEPLKTGLLNTDPIKYWRKWSAIASAILDLAAELNQNRIGGRNEWRIVSIYHMHGEKPNDALYRNVKKHGLEGARWGLNLHLTAWLRFGEVLPLMRWNENHNEWEITLGSRRDSLFGAIGLALMMAVAEKPGLAICSSCHKSYAPGRRPNPHRRNYCETCGKRAAWRDAASQRRKRLREQEQSPV
jgi:hypothetical protein